MDCIHNLFAAYFTYLKTYNRQPLRGDQDLNAMKLFYKRAGAKTVDHDLINSALYTDKYIREESARFFGSHLAQLIFNGRTIGCADLVLQYFDASVALKGKVGKAGTIYDEDVYYGTYIKAQQLIQSC